MKRRNLILAVLVLALVLSAGIGSAWAYFTTYSSASGGKVLRLGYQTEFEERIDRNRKIVDIRYDRGPGNENEQEVYVRVKAWSPDPEKYPLSVEPGSGWVSGPEGWWYYTEPLGPENLEAAPLTIEIGGLTVTTDTPPEALPKDGDSINVAVVHECAPVLYKEDGTPYEATDPLIWEQTLIVESAAPEGGE